MNAARNLVIDFRINGKHDHYINKDKKVQPHLTNDKAHGNRAKHKKKCS